MASTSLESIKEKLDEANKLKLEEILATSGSNALAKNEFGVTNVDDTNIASSLLFKPLNRQKLNNEEIIKSLDPSIKELKPLIPTERKDLIPKPLYDEQVATNDDLRKQIDTLNNIVNTLNSEINNLKSQVEEEINNRLRIEQSNDVLTNQSQTLGTTIEDFSTQIQSSLQKSVEESILRGSLQAQNAGFRAQIEALIKQIDSLNSIIEGLQSQLGAVQQQQAIQQSTSNLAATTGGLVVNEIAVISFEPKPSNANGPQMVGRFKSGGGSKWDVGGVIRITNNDTANVTVKFSVDVWPDGKAFFRIPPETNVAPNESKTINVVLNESAVRDVDSRPKRGPFGGHTGSNFYGGGKFKISVTRTTDGTTKDKIVEIGFDKKHPKSY